MSREYYYRVLERLMKKADSEEDFTKIDRINYHKAIREIAFANFVDGDSGQRSLYEGVAEVCSQILEEEFNLGHQRVRNPKHRKTVPV